AEANVPMVISNQASTPMEALSGVGERWFQLYWSVSDELGASLVGRAGAAGCEAIVRTADTHLLRVRPLGLGIGKHPVGGGRGIAQYTSDPVFTELVRERAARPATGAKPRITAQTLRSFAEISRNYPGSLGSNLRSPLPRAAVETFLD